MGFREKGDLRTGMVVETKNGKMFMVFAFLNTSNGATEVIVNLDGSGEYLHLNYYKDDLSINYRACGQHDGYDIVKVFRPRRPSQTLSLREKEDIYREYELLWGKDVVKEMTLSELEEKLGYKVKISEGKDERSKPSKFERTRKYFQEVLDIIDNLSEEELDDWLIEAGLSEIKDDDNEDNMVLEQEDKAKDKRDVIEKYVLEAVKNIAVRGVRKK